MAANDSVVGDDLDAQLEALLSSDAPASADGKGTPPKPAKTPAVVASPPLANKEDGAEEDPLEKALKEIDEDKAEEKPEVPALSDEQSAILAAVPTAETATQLYAVAQNYNNFTNAFESGNYEAVQRMFENWNAPAFDGFLEHIYAQKVASGEWVDRFIADHEGKGKEHQGMKALQREIASVKAQLAQRSNGEQQTQAEAQQKQSYEAYNKHVDGLFDKINYSTADRPWVVATLNARVAADPKLLAQLKAGNAIAVNTTFKNVVREYGNRDKLTAAAANDKIAQQSQKKMLTGGGGTAPTDGVLPDDIRQVPKGQEDSWMDQQLGKLKALTSRKK